MSLEKLKKFEFTGYILIKNKTTGSTSQSYLVVKDGALVSAIYGRDDDGKFMATKEGEDGLKLAWADSYDKNASLEVHGRLDVNLILSHYPDARITKVMLRVM